MSAAQNAQRGNAPSRGQAPARPQPRGPVALLIGMIVAFTASVFTSLFLGTAIELVGSYTLWKDQGVMHARDQVTADLAYIDQFPRSILVDDTKAFAQDMARTASWPWMRLGALQMFERARAVDFSVPAKPTTRVLQHILVEIARVLEIMLYVAQDTAVRLAVAFFALPAFFLACLLGMVDGLMRRDLRKWGGGRESSFIYHHSKHYTGWFLTGGFSLYLAWPVANFNPAYMVLVFAVLVAVSLSITVASFKKYL